MRVLFVNHMGFLGGGELSMLALMEGLRETGYHRVMLLAPPGELADRARDLGFGVFGFPFQEIRRTVNPWRWLMGAVRLWRGVGEVARLLRAERVDVLHANSLKAAVLGGCAARCTGTAMVFHTRDYLRAGVWGGLLVGWAYRLADAVIVNSRSVASVYGNDPQHKVAVVYNAVGPVTAPSAVQGRKTRNERGIGRHDPVIAYVGRLHPDKHLESLIDAYALVRRTSPAASLWIIGDAMPGEAAYAEGLRRMAERTGAFGRIVFWGWRRDANELLACCDVLVVPSKKEPFGRTTVEAMLLGVPVVATAAGGTLEIVEDGVNGLLFPPGDRAALAAAIRRLLTDRALARRLAGRARKDATARFGRRQYIDGVERVYAALVG